MAALCPGVQYGLSSQENFGENKDLIFVKLTDSAFRAIEEYLRNQNKFSQNPSIQFLGNEGHLSFPSEHGSSGCASFNFSISSTADMEGPGGSFECARQSGPPRGSLESLGPIPHKMRIHANEDVYEATRQRMTVAEENHKKKSTRVIKPNPNEIGRKVKVKQAPGRPLPIPQRREPIPPTRESLSKPSYPSSNISSSNKSSSVHSSNGLGSGIGSNHMPNSRPQNKPSTPDGIMRRPIKERLIHLLALRPFKKPELYERINRDGREKSVLSTVLKQIAYMQGNTYHLHQHMWNDVNEDWPFYTEQEKQLLKRRKPQNLTPPGSSDTGSSGSGQSPTSTHPGSPPPPVTSSVKRPGYVEGVDGLPTKRARISHYRKPEPSTLYGRPAQPAAEQRRPPTDSRDTSNMNPRSREPAVNSYLSTTTLANGYSLPSINGNNGYCSSTTPNDKRQYSDEENDVANRKRACDSHINSISYTVNREKTVKENSICNSPNKNAMQDELRLGQGKESPLSRTALHRRTDSNRQEREREEREREREREKEREREREREREKERTRWNKVSSTTHNDNSVSRVSPDSQLERIAQSESTRPPPPASPSPTPPPPVHRQSGNTVTEFPDYLTEYTTIRSIEQRRRYKSDFNADYAEYRDLHAVVERVSRRFAQLEERLKQENQSSQGYKEIKKQIVRDYKENQRDGEYQRGKRRFQYLHDKLSHIKRLVLEYDQGMATGHGQESGGGDPLSRYLERIFT